MLDRLERIAVFLHGFRWWFLVLCVLVFVSLAILEFRGYETTGPFVLSFMWFVGIALFVESFQRTKRLQEAKRMKGIVPGFMHQFFTSDAFAYFTAFFFMIWFGSLAFITVRLVAS